jgi:hypothetical protein
MIIATSFTIVLWKELLGVFENGSGDDVGASGHCSLSPNIYATRLFPSTSLHDALQSPDTEHLHFYK